MGFHLRITFTGLCLFVPSRDGSTLHVVLPDPVAASGMKDKHFASIFYDSGYDSGHALTNSFTRIPLEKVNVASPAGRPTTATPPVSSRVFDSALVADVTAATLAVSPPKPGDSPGKGRVNPAVLSATHPWVASTFTIPGGRLLGYAASGPWGFPTAADRTFLAWHVDWVVDNIVTSPKLQLQIVDTGGSVTVREFVPIHNVVELRVKNVPLAESMGEDPPYDPSAAAGVHHFVAFYAMLNGVSGGPVPDSGGRGTLITCTPATGQL